MRKRWGMILGVEKCIDVWYRRRGKSEFVMGFLLSTKLVDIGFFFGWHVLIFIYNKTCQPCNNIRIFGWIWKRVKNEFVDDFFRFFADFFDDCGCFEYIDGVVMGFTWSAPMEHWFFPLFFSNFPCFCENSCFLLFSTVLLVIKCMILLDRFVFHTRIVISRVFRSDERRKEWEKVVLILQSNIWMKIRFS